MEAPDHSAAELPELVSLSGRTAVVTGAARGIGFAISRRLAQAGATVHLADLDPDAADRSASELRSQGLEVHPAEADASDNASLETLAHEVARGNRLDIWVNNAGIYPVEPIEELGPEAWERVIRLNLSGTYFGARAAASHMSPGGVIVNVASTAAQRPGMPGIAHYAASKAGVEGLTKALAQDLGAVGIRVLAVSPTMVLTEGVAAHAVFGANEPQQMFAEMLPLGRPARADDVARVVLFCATPLSSFMTGSVLFADGGHMTS